MLNFIEIFKRVCSEQGVKCSIVEQQVATDILYTCNRGTVGFEFFVEHYDNLPTIIQYRIHNEEWVETEWEHESKLYNNDSYTPLTEDEIEECILWMLEEVEIRYEIANKFAKPLNKIFAQVENEEELFILKELFNTMCEEF